MVVRPAPFLFTGILKFLIKFNNLTNYFVEKDGYVINLV